MKTSGPLKAKDILSPCSSGGAIAPPILKKKARPPGTRRIRAPGLQQVLVEGTGTHPGSSLMKAPSTQGAARERHARWSEQGASKCNGCRPRRREGAHFPEVRAPRPQAGRVETRNPKEPEQSLLSQVVSSHQSIGSSQIHQKLYHGKVTKNCIMVRANSLAPVGTVVPCSMERWGG